MIEEITAANVPGGNGMISKLTGGGGVATKVADAVSGYEAGTIDGATYVAQLMDALDTLGAFDNQLAAKIGNGRITEPGASHLLELSGHLRETIEGGIANAP